MGSDNSKPVKKPLQKFDLEIVCEKISRHLQLQRDRKINELANKERELADKIKSNRKGYEDITIEIGSLVNLLKYITASKIVIRYTGLIKDQSLRIVDACRTNNFSTITQLTPYFEGIVWSKSHLNLNYINELNQLLSQSFRETDLIEIHKFNKVDKDLKECFSTIEPTPVEIQKYLTEFLKRHNITNFQWPSGRGPYQEQPPNYYQPPQNPQYPPYQPHQNQWQQFQQPMGQQMQPQSQNFAPQSGNMQNANFVPVQPTPPTNPNMVDDNAIDNLLNELNMGATHIPAYENKKESENTAQIPQIPDIKNEPTPIPQIPQIKNESAPLPEENLNIPGLIPPAQMNPNQSVPQQGFPMKTGYQKVKNLAAGPEAFTDENDDNCEFGQFDVLPFPARIDQMRQAKI